MSASIVERKIWKLENIINILNVIALELTIASTESGAMGYYRSKCLFELESIINPSALI